MSGIGVSLTRVGGSWKHAPAVAISAYLALSFWEEEEDDTPHIHAWNMGDTEIGIVEYEVSQLVCGNELAWIAKMICQAYIFWPGYSKLRRAVDYQRLIKQENLVWPIRTICPKVTYACICQSVKVCHSRWEDRKTMTYRHLPLIITTRLVKLKHRSYQWPSRLVKQRVEHCTNELSLEAAANGISRVPLR